MGINEYEQRQTELQKVTRDWLLRGEPNVIVTLTFRSEDKVTFENAVKVFGTFAHQLKSHFFGEKSKKRIYMVPVVEGYQAPQMEGLAADKRTHIHCLMRLPDDPSAYKGVIREVWMASSGICGDPNVYCPNNDDWFLVLDSEERKRVFTNYVLKTCGIDTEAVLWKFVPIRHMT